MKLNGISTYSKVMGVASWSKICGVVAGTDWSSIFTYTTNATATEVTNWIGAAISTSPIVPNVINGQPVVVTASTTFRGKTALTNCNIESNVAFSSNSMANAFNGCTNLVNAPAIPANVTNMVSTFRNCTSLVNAPTIGANVTNMAAAFNGCTNLVNAPAIPAKVTNMTSTFRDCTNLTGNITIVNSNVTNFTDCFTGTNASLAKNLLVPAGSATNTLARSVCDGKNGVTVVEY